MAGGDRAVGETPAPLRLGDPAVVLLRRLLAVEGRPLSLCSLGAPLEELSGIIETLCAHGAEVSLVPEVGLSASRSGRLSAAEFLACRKPGSWPAAALCLVSAGSTQDVAAHWAQRGFADGVVVSADYQTHGRGRQGRRWFSESGRNLLASFVLRDEHLHPLGALRVALAVYDALAPWVGDCLRLRWPNDVVAGGRKLAGTLIEPLPSGGAVVGVGINVNQSMQAVPGRVARPATSLLELLGRPVDRMEVLSALANELEGWCLRGRGDEGAILEAYRERCATLGRAITVVTRAGRVAGVATGLGAAGELLVDAGGSRRVALLAGDVVETRQGEE